MKILAIESSCDETACAIVQDGTTILSNVVASSTDMYQKYGGIVPEIAAREQLKYIIPVITEALTILDGDADASMLHRIHDHIDAIAVTVGPGLIGSLLVGIETAKTIAFVTGKPIIPVNHVFAHMYANFISQNSHVKTYSENSAGMQQIDNSTITFPAISLVVSGGHTELYLMESQNKLMWLGGTLDDAAGEAFDKTARLLGFGNRGGQAIQEAAAKNQRNKVSKIKLPRPMMHDKTLNFSFSGLKTAILREVNAIKSSQQFNHITMQQLAFEVQEAITDVLVSKTYRAVEQYNAKSILISGGVAANKRLREKFSSTNQQDNNVTIFVPPPVLCTDNAAYIGSYAYFRGVQTDWHTISAFPDLSVER